MADLETKVAQVTTREVARSRMAAAHAVGWEGFANTEAIADLLIEVYVEPARPKPATREERVEALRWLLDHPEECGGDAGTQKRWREELGALEATA